MMNILYDQLKENILVKKSPPPTLFEKIPGELIREIYDFDNIGLDYQNKNESNRLFRSLFYENITLNDCITILKLEGNHYQGYLEIYEKEIKIIESLKYLKYFHLAKGCLNNLPKFSFRLEKLSLIGIVNLNEITINKEYKALKFLYIRQCQQLKTLSIDEEIPLIELTCNHCFNLESILNVAKAIKKMNLWGSMKISKIPLTLLNLEEITCQETNVSEIPKTFIKLKKINVRKTNVSFLPKELINLTKIYPKDIDRN